MPPFVETDHSLLGLQLFRKTLGKYKSFGSLGIIVTIRFVLSLFGMPVRFEHTLDIF